MDADGLPLVGSGVDYTKVEAIQQKRTIAFINHFITHTASFLNRFSCVCEEKLEHLSNRIQNLEITLSLLETKLSSIPGLDSVTAPTVASETPASTSAPGAPPAPAAPLAQGAPPPPPTQDDGPPPPPPEEETPSNPVSKDPRYAKFFKMLQVGVPAPAVKNKMKAEGLDDSLLDTPDAPAPPEQKKADSDSDEFGDSDDDSMSD
ncbi:WASH complex subunit 3-like [Ostrea edulis]|uniref:WASH complex subunit 3-like n=1 Tax=Ostrea edulis TaxID=37623 RepID=UPI0024AFFCA9|nr:WASH complex subunit 3-like [Ostrea edulis]